MVTACLALALGTSSVAAQSDEVPAAPPSPFAAFETRVLPNGLKVWFKHAPGMGDVSVSVAVPFGADRDPPGKEELAHFTEHMLFADRPGLTEEEIKRALSERGGIRNGLTFWDHTFYFARVEPSHGLFALEWLYGILSPREIRPELVERQRIPVMIELRARQRGLGEWVVARVIDPPLLRLPEYWQREFGLSTRRERDYYPWRSVNDITAEDVRDFYDRYYAPSHLTLTVIGDLPPDSVWAVIGRTFALLPSRNSRITEAEPRDPGRERRMNWWSFRSSVLYDERYKSYQRSPRDELLMIFLSRRLDQRLNERLRYGERKVVYGISSYVQRRGVAAQWLITGTVKKEEKAYARAVIAEELARLSREIPDSAFAAERAEIAARLRVQAVSAEALERWVSSAFYDRRRFVDFPDLVGEFSSLTQTEVREFARRSLAPERRFVAISNVIPIPQSVVIILGLLAVALAVRFARRLLVRPLPMLRLRYVARIRRPLVMRLLGGLIYLVAVAILLRLVVYAYQWIYVYGLLGIDNFVVQWAAFAAGGMVLVILVIAAGALIPTKVLVFEHGLALKAYAYRSTFIRAESVAEIAMKTLQELIAESGYRVLWTTRIMTPALREPALFIRRINGASLLLRTRNTRELLDVLRAFSPRDPVLEQEVIGS